MLHNFKKINIFIILLDLASSINNSLLLESYANGALISLARYTIQKSNWLRYGSLLLGLRQLSLRRYETSLSVLFRSIVSDVLKNI